MEDTKLFARDCDVFFKKRLFTPNVTPENLALRIEAAVYLMAQNLRGIEQNKMSDGPRLPTIADMVMGTHGPGLPHLEQLITFLKNSHLTADFYNAMHS
jgi:hypothetical protein